MGSPSSARDRNDTKRTTSFDGYLAARGITRPSLSMFGQAVGELNPG